MAQIPNDLPDDAIVDAWYRYVSEQPGFVGPLLRILRDRQGLTVQQQQDEFGIDSHSFLRLQGMPLPRAGSFAADALVIAEACGLPNPLALVRALTLARNLERSIQQTAAMPVYQAAFDAINDLDRLPEE
jgi:hypothetical protein